MAIELNITDEELLELAKKAAGNWRKFESFGWHGKPDDADNYTIVNISNRDSNIMEQSNAAAIKKEFAPYFKRGTAWMESHRHWAVGYVDALVVKVFTTKGKITQAFRKLVELEHALEAYPLLDEEDYSRREYEAAIKAIEEQGRRMDTIDELPENWAGKVFSWLWKNDQDELENRDDEGAYPSEESIEAALTALGWMNPQEDEEE